MKPFFHICSIFTILPRGSTSGPAGWLLPLTTKSRTSLLLMTVFNQLMNPCFFIQNLWLISFNSTLIVAQDNRTFKQTEGMNDLLQGLKYYDRLWKIVRFRADLCRTPHATRSFWCHLKYVCLSWGSGYDIDCRRSSRHHNFQANSRNEYHTSGTERLWKILMFRADLCRAPHAKRWFWCHLKICLFRLRFRV